MRRLIVTLSLAIAAAPFLLAPHAGAGLGATGHAAPRAGDVPGSWIQAVVEPPSAAPGTGHGFLIDRHIAKGLTCKACHTTAPGRPVSTGICLSCHGGTYDKLAATSAADDPNPHQSHQGAVPCNACHHVHTASENFCAQCHAEFDFKVP